MTSSFLSSSEIHNPDLTTLHGKKSEVLGSQPVITKEGKDHLVSLDVTKMEKPQENSKEKAHSSVSLAARVPCNLPSIPTSLPEHSAFPSEECGRIEEQVNKDQESKNPNEVPCKDKTALDAGDRFTLLTAHKMPSEQSKAKESICTYSLSPSEVSGGGIIEKESPESPFEVIVDKATFDREFSNSYKESTSDLAGCAVHDDKESPTDMLETNDKLFPLRKEVRRYPTSALLTRQFSHTTAALEEVSRCVSDMHNFTNEILTWDLVPQVKQQTDKSDYTRKSTGLNRNDYPSEIPVVSLKTNTHQKIPVCSINGNTAITKSVGNWAEDSLPQENTITGKPSRDSLNPTREVSVKDMQSNPQKQDDTLSELPGSPHGVVPVKVILSDDHLKNEISWQSSVLGEATEADSSGESDDTVIEDIVADKSFENNKIPAKNPVSTPDTIVKTDEREIKELPSCKMTENKNSKEPVSNPEVHEVQPDIFGRNPVGETVYSQAPHKDVISEDREQADTISEFTPGKLITTDNPQLPAAAPPDAFNVAEFSLKVRASAKSESLYGKHVKDIDESSPEDLIAAITEIREKRIVDKKEREIIKTISEKMTDYKKTLSIEVLHENESGGSQIKDIKEKYIEQGKETNESEFLGVFSTQGPVASLDLEQEQLTIRALKELGERQAEKLAAAQKEESHSEERLEQTFAPESCPQRSYDVLGHTDVKIGSDLEMPKKLTIFKETRVDVIPSISKNALVNKHVLTRLLTDFSGNHLR